RPRGRRTRAPCTRARATREGSVLRTRRTGRRDLALRAPPSTPQLFPVVGAVANRRRLTGLGPLGGGDELADLHRVLVPGARLHTGDDVDAPRVDAGDGLADVLNAQPARHQQ